MPTFIDTFLKLTEEAESPKSFFYYSALACISAVVRKNVWINKRLYRVYPNLFIMFIAKSALRKGYPVNQARKLVEETEVMKVISGQNSIQSIITELSKQWTSESGKIFREAQAFIVNDELDALLIQDPSAQTLLTTLYDSYLHKKWQKTIKKDGREVLDNLYITMLTATNEDHLDAFLDKASIKGGFLGRTLIIHEKKLAQINPLIEEDDNYEVDMGPLVEFLKHLSEVKGQFKFSKDAINFYYPWYKKFMEKLQDGEIIDDTGCAGRAGDTVLKLAMCLSLNESFNQVIELPHIERGIELFYRSLKDVRRLVEGRGKSDLSEKNRIVLQFLLSRPDYTASKKEILAANYGDIEAMELDRVTDTMRQAGLLEVKTVSNEGLVYKINEKFAERFDRRFKR